MSEMDSFYLDLLAPWKSRRYDEYTRVNDWKYSQIRWSYFDVVEMDLLVECGKTDSHRRCFIAFVSRQKLNAANEGPSEQSTNFGK